jgi:hypothetical protein
MLVFVIYTVTKFPYTYITMEGDDFWVLTKDYWQLKLAILPAFTNWFADFLMQFYRSPYIAATIQALVLGMIGVLAHAVLMKLLGNKLGLCWLALLPPVLLAFYCTFSLSFQLQCLFFVALLLIYISLKSFKWRLLCGLLCVPLGFLLMRAPLLAILIVAQALSNREKLKHSIGGGLAGAVLLAITPLAYSQQIAFIPFEERYTEWGTYFDPLTSKYNQDGEYIKKCVCLANEGRWKDLLYKEHIRSDAQRGKAASLRYALLAESALGTLPENISYYPIQDESQFLFQHEQNAVAQQFNRLFYQNLGIYDEAFHQAQEYGLLMPNGNCFSSLRQLVDYSIEEGEWDIAEKFLQVLSKSSCHKDFVEGRKERIQKSKSRNSKSIPLRADNFVGGFPLPIEMLRLARYYQDSPHRKKMVDYAICSYLLRGDAEKFIIATKAFDIYKDQELPKAYKEFLDNYP